MEHKYFPNNTQLYIELHKLHEEFDPSESMVMSRYSFKDIQGEQYLAYDFATFVDKFNDRFGMTIDRANSQSAGRQSYLVKFLDVAEKPVEVSIETPVEPLVKASVEHKEVADTLVATEVVTPDWKLIESFGNTKEDKLAFEQYADKNFGIKLKRSMTIDKMVDSFKESLK